MPHLDMLRGAAALLVFQGHLRSFVFAGFHTLHSSGAALKIFYAVTSLGHAAVVVFFALSGYLVGGKALADMLGGRWRWDRYLLRRLTRLWIVLIPALLATLLLDSVGMSLGGKGYAGEYYSIYASGPTSGDHSFVTMLGNLFFLQTIAVPVFGTNGPLWSLANEFWYYVLFPLMASIVFVRRQVWLVLLSFIAAIVLVAWLPFVLVLGGSIWIAGAAAVWAGQQEILRPYFKHPAYLLAAAFVFAGGLAFEKMSSGLVSDLVFGFSTALSLPCLAYAASPGRLYNRISHSLSEISYTLYLTHFPLLGFIFFVFYAPHRWLPGMAGAAIYLAATGVALIWAVLLWWCFERNTGVLFRFLDARLISDNAKMLRGTSGPAGMM